MILEECYHKIKITRNYYSSKGIVVRAIVAATSSFINRSLPKERQKEKSADKGANLLLNAFELLPMRRRKLALLYWTRAAFLRLQPRMMMMLVALQPRFRCTTQRTRNKTRKWRRNRSRMPNLQPSTAEGSKIKVHFFISDSFRNTNSMLCSGQSVRKFNARSRNKMPNRHLPRLLLCGAHLMHL